LYPDAVAHNNYSKTLTSVTFAGTVVGMLIFGWISDKMGRKFGMVRITAAS
jgi:MFS family permease